MCSLNPFFIFLNGFSRGDIISLIGIGVAVFAIFFIVWWDRRKKRQEVIDAFIQPLLRLKTVIETNSIPPRDAYDEFIRQFATHENSMSVIRNKMVDETRTNFDKKWEEYKNERDKYKNYWDTNLKGKFSIHKNSNQFNTTINELINIANKI